MNMDKVFAFVFFTMLFLAVVLGFTSFRDGIFLRKQHSSETIFQRRRSFRTFMLCMFLLLAVGVPYSSLPDMRGEHRVSTAKWSQSDYKTAQDTAWGMTIMAIGVGLGLLCFCSPEELRMDTNKRTYRLTKGWPPFARTYLGEWENINGIYIKSINSAYLICLDYKHPAPLWTLIGVAGKHRKAASLAQEIASSLSLSTINPPR